VVDLERGHPIALLPERSEAVVRPWLEAHPTITVVARDRSTEFAAAITQALPNAVRSRIAGIWPKTSRNGRTRL
jgi:transposase